MFYEFNENWRVINSSNVKINWNYIEKDFTDEEVAKLNSWYSYNIETWEFEESIESKEIEKQLAIQEFKELEKTATNKRAEYLTAELLPDWEFKTIKLTKLFNEWEEIKTQYENKMQELIDKYWKSILNEII